ncbi:MAG: hypothetical protein AABY79_10760 [Nitrospirota bacterium]|jgi:hypothetical protein
MYYKNITRRGFLRLIGSLGILIGSTRLSEAAQAVECLPSSSHSRQTMLAVTHAVVPGAENSPDKSAGAADACALDIIYDPYYGLEPYIALLVISIDWSSIIRYGRLYKNLSFDKRTYVLQLKEEGSWFLKKGFKGIIILTKIAFYGGYKNSIGLEYIGFPGANPGYYDFSHDKVFAREKTVDGNLK